MVRGAGGAAGAHGGPDGAVAPAPGRQRGAAGAARLAVPAHRWGPALPPHPMHMMEAYIVLLRVTVTLIIADYSLIL